MAKKRGNGEGTISKRKDGKWCAAITVGRDPATGKLKRKFFYGKTRKEVAEKMTKALSQINQGTYIEPSKMTLSEWLDIWLRDYKKSNLRPTTYTSYEYLIRVHIKPSIGHIPLKDLRPDHLQTLYNEKLENGRSDGKGGLSARTVRYIHVVIHEALDQAVKNGLIVRNVSEATTIPRKQKKDMRVLTLEEQIKFYEAIQGHRLEMFFTVALSTGMRLGELLAIRWQDIDLKNNKITVRQALSRTKDFDNNTQNKTKLIFQEPKTKAGKRTIPIPDSVVKLLKQHRKKQIEEKFLVGELYQDYDLVFVTELGTPIDHSNMNRQFKKLIEKAELKDVNFHALRHTYATRLLEANEHPKVVQEILGHSSITMTLDTYSHVMPEIKHAAAEKINDLFLRNEKTPSKMKGTH